MLQIGIDSLERKRRISHFSLPSCRQGAACNQPAQRWAASPPRAPQPCCPPLPEGAGFGITVVEGSLYWPETPHLRAHGEDFSAGKCLFMRLKGESWLRRAPDLRLCQHLDCCPCAASYSPSTEAPCPLSQGSPKPPIPNNLCTLLSDLAMSVSSPHRTNPTRARRTQIISNKTQPSLSVATIHVWTISLAAVTDPTQRPGEPQAVAVQDLSSLPCRRDTSLQSFMIVITGWVF